MIILNFIHFAMRLLLIWQRNKNQFIIIKRNTHNNRKITYEIWAPAIFFFHKRRNAIEDTRNIKCKFTGTTCINPFICFSSLFLDATDRKLSWEKFAAVSSIDIINWASRTTNVDAFPSSRDASFGICRPRPVAIIITSYDVV